MAGMARTSQQDLQYRTILTNHALHNPKIPCPITFFTFGSLPLFRIPAFILWKLFSWVSKGGFLSAFFFWIISDTLSQSQRRTYYTAFFVFLIDLSHPIAFAVFLQSKTTLWWRLP